MIRLLTTIACLSLPLTAQERVAIAKPRDPAPAVHVLPVGDLAVNPNLEDDDPRSTLAGIARFGSKFVQPPLRNGEEIKAIGGKTLVGLLRPAQHDWLKLFVASNVAHRGKMVDVQCRFVQMTKGAYVRLAKPVFAGENKNYVELRKSPKTTKYLDNLPKYKGVNLLNAPRLLALASQRATMSVINQTTYWKDFEAQFDDKDRVIGATPIAGVVQDGMWLDSTCGFVAEGVIGISIHAKWSELKRPIKEVDLRVKGAPKPLKIGVPEVDVAEIKADVRVKAGNTVMFQLPSTNGKRLFVFVTVDAIDPLKPKRK